MTYDKTRKNLLKSIAWTFFLLFLSYKSTIWQNQKLWQNHLKARSEKRKNPISFRLLSWFFIKNSDKFLLWFPTLLTVLRQLTSEFCLCALYVLVFACSTPHKQKPHCWGFHLLTVICFSYSANRKFIIRLKRFISSSVVASRIVLGLLFFVGFFNSFFVEFEFFIDFFFSCKDLSWSYVSLK